jgi:DNA helicase II / ATP-dependent DNA helicase PcrA
MQTNIFKKEYLKLNKAQKEAVDSIDGPVMVIAWPWTWKTQIIWLRTANIILKSWVEPENILITTFTEAWVIAIRERLLQFIWNEAYKITICTIHSFAQEVIKRFPEKFIEYKVSISIDEVENLEIIKYLLEKWIKNKKIENLTNNFDPYLYLRDIKSRISILKQEWIQKDKFKSLIKIQTEEYKEILWQIKPELKKYKLTEDKQKKHIKKLKELNFLFKEYNKYLRKHWKYDFNDMINFVLEKFRWDEGLIYHYAEKYQYIMVDEYQDTNNSQNEIINLLSSINELETNVMVVWDDDQSIYRFQWANIENILDFSSNYKNTKFIVLENNYRSNQKILDTSRQLIENNKERIVNKIKDLEKNLISSQNKKEIKPKLLKAKNDIEEKTFILNEIKEKLKKWQKPDEIAIIVRNNKEVVEYTNFLSQNQIETQSKLKNNILKSDYIKYVINYLKIINNPYENEKILIDILRSKIAKLNQIDILKINRELYKENYRKKYKTKMMDFLNDENKLWKIELKEKDTLLKFRDDLLSLWSDLSELNIIEFFNKFLKKTWILEYIETKSFDDIEDLYTFFKKIKDRTTQIKDFSIEELFSKLDLYIWYDYPIVRQVFRKQDLWVQVLTAHSSKWLEYETIFIPWLYHWNWENKRIIDKIKLPALSWEWLQSTSNKYLQIEEDRRLFFVAITRAKNELYLSFPAWIWQKPLLQSMFVEEIKDCVEVVEYLPLPNPLAFSGEGEEQRGGNKSPLSWKERGLGGEVSKSIINELKNDIIVYSDLEFDYIEEFLKTYKLSASDLNTFLENPKDFLNKVVFKYPFEDNKFTIFWKVYHRTLELFYLKFKNENLLPEKSYLTSKFSVLLKKEILTPEEKKELEEKWIKWLEWYFDGYLSKSKQALELEYSFRYKNIIFDFIPVTWTIDKIEKIDYKQWFSEEKNTSLFKTPSLSLPPREREQNNLEKQEDKQLTLFKEIVSLIDYKTGKIKTLWQIKWLDKYWNKKKWEWKYLRQLFFYKLLCENDKEFMSKYEIWSLNIDFVEWKDWVYKNVVIDYSMEEYQDFKEELKEVRKQIKDINFWRDLLLDARL